MQDVTAQLNAPTSPPDMITEVRTWALRIASVLALIAVVGAPAAASWHGLTGFGVRELGLSGGWQYLVPISLDGAALYAALLALRAILAGDSAIWPRVLTCAYALAAASANVYAAPSDVAALFYGGMSVSAVVLWDTTLRALRRDQLRTLGVIEGAVARYRPLRWMLAPTETGQAWRTAVLEGVQNPRTALSMVRGEIVRPDPDGTPPDGGGLPLADFPLTPAATARDYLPAASAPLALTVGTKANAIRAAFDALGRRDVPAALAWLAARGVQVDRSYAYTVSWETPPLLRAVGGDR